MSRIASYVARLLMAASLQLSLAGTTTASGQVNSQVVSRDAGGFSVQAIVAMLDEAAKNRKPFDDLRAQVLRPLDLKSTEIAPLKERAYLALKLGAFPQAADISKAMVERGGFAERATGRFLLAMTELARGNVYDAIRSYEHAADAIPGWHGSGIELFGQLANVYMFTGQIEKADKAIAQAEKTTQYARSLRWGWTWEESYLASLYRFRGYLSLLKGNLEEAEKELRKSIQHFDTNTPLRAKYMQESAGYRDAAVPDELYFYGGAMSHAWLGTALAARGKTAEGVFHASKALVGGLHSAGFYSPRTASFLLMLSEVLLERGGYEDADRLLDYAVRIFEELGVERGAALWIMARLTKARALIGLERHAEALDVLLKIEEDRKHAQARDATREAVNEPLFLAETSYALLMVERNAEVVARLDSAIPFYESRLGPDHAHIALLHAMRGIAKARSGVGRDEGMQEARSALRRLIEHGVTDVSPSRQKVMASLFEIYAELLPDVDITSATHMQELFQMTDLLRNQGAQRALRAAAARAKVPDPSLAALVRRQQDLENEAEALTRIIMELSMRPADKQLPAVLTDMQHRLKRIGEESAANGQTMDKRFPAYAQLMRPRTPSFAELRQSLAPDETFLSILPMKRRTYVWAITRDDEPAMHVARLGADRIAALVTKLRRAFVFDDGVQPPPYDFESASSLYLELLEPVAARWTRHSLLTVSAAGALSQLPLGTLLTKPYVASAGQDLAHASYAAAAWLIRQIAVAEIPSAAALVTLRQAAPGNPQRKALIGFGDPEFNASAATLNAPREVARNLTIAKALARNDTAIPAATSARFAPAHPESQYLSEYSRIPALPDTRDELLSIAHAVGADPAKDLFLGSRASRDAVMKEDLSGRRIVAFATHGVLPGEFPGLDQPALAMANPGQSGSGFLTAADVMSLKLDADWVVLSACNTAAGEGQGAEAMSGLGRAFFFAGGRALLATHWAVESNSARQLVSGIFERHAKSPGLSRAKALQQTLVALIDAPRDPGQGPSLAHPAFWAPYALIGDGATH